MPEDTCTSLNLDMDSCSPKKLCCGEGGVQAYNSVGACPPNQGYSVNSEKCQCCRPPCTPQDYRVTATFYRADWNWEGCLSDNNCTGPGAGPQFWAGASITRTLQNVSNPWSYEVDIEEAPLFGPFVCNCYVASGTYGSYILRFDEGCPSPQDMGWNFLQFQNAGIACEGPCSGWSVASAYYHTIDLIERYDSGTGSWVPA